MNIENAICPCCNDELRVNVPSDRAIENVFIATSIFTSFTKKLDQRFRCPQCTIEVFVRLSQPARVPYK